MTILDFHNQIPVVIMYSMFNIVLHCSTCPVLSSCNCFPRFRGSSDKAKETTTETFNQSRVACHLSRIRSIMIWKPSWLPEFRTPFGPCNLLRVTGMESGPILGAVCCSSIQRFLSGCCSTKPKATQNRVYNDFDKNYSAKTMIRLKELCLEVGRILISKCAH